MSRIFLSHSSADNAHAIALRDWLVAEGWNDLFLDLDPERGIAAGERWELALNEAARRCEAVLFLISKAWLASRWCINELTLARRLNKRLFGVLIEEGQTVADLPHDVTSTWQLVNLATGRDHKQFLVTLPVTGEEVHVTYSVEGLVRLKGGLQRAGLQASYFDWPPAHNPKRAPYRGLRPLEADDAGIFFGREAPLIEAIDRLRGLTEGAPPRLIVILGASGAGKSSFLRAGLLPRLGRDQRTFLPLPVIRPERAVLSGETGLVNALAAACDAVAVKVPRADIRAAIEGGAVSLKALLARLQAAAQLPGADGVASKPPTLVIAIDQGEELFLAEVRQEAEQFLVLLRELIGSDTPSVIAVCTIRSDNYERLQQTPELADIHKIPLDLGPMPKGSYAEVVKGPIRRLDGTARAIKVDEALVDALLADIEAGGAKDALPLLAFTLERLYDEYGATGHLTLGHYVKLGRIKGSIEAAVERALDSAGSDSRIPSERAARLALLRRGLIPWLAGIDPDTGAPRRRVARLSEIPIEARPLIDLLIEQRLLSTDINKETREKTVEPAHEALLRQWGLLQGWLSEDFENLATLEGVKRATRDWAANDRSPEWLAHSGGRLEAAERAASREDLARSVEPTERSYLHACRDQHDRKIRVAAEQFEREKAQVERTKRLQGLLGKVLFIAGACALLLFAAAASVYREVTFKDARIAEANSAAAFEGSNFEKAGAAALAGLPPRGALPLHYRSRELETTLRNATAHTRLIAELGQHQAGISRVSWSWDGSRIVTSSDREGAARLWDGKSGALIALVEGHRGEINWPSWCPDGAQVVTWADDDGIARLFDGKSGAEIAKLDGHQGGIKWLYCSHDGTRVVTWGKSDHVARLWDAKSGMLIAVLEGHLGPISFVEFSKNGPRLASWAETDSVARLWDARSGALIAKLEGHHGPISRATWSPDRLRLLTWAKGDNVARLWDSRSGDLVAALHGHLGPISAGHWSHDGTRLVTRSESDPRARLWDGGSGALVATLIGHAGPIVGIGLSPDGLRIVTRAQSDAIVRVWDSQSGALIAKLEGHIGPISLVTWSKDWSRLITKAENDPIARLWEGKSGALISEVKGHRRPVYDPKWSSDQSRFVTWAEDDKVVRLWDSRSGALIAEMEGHEGPIYKYGVTWSPDGLRIATRANGDPMARLWDGKSGALITALEGHKRPIDKLDWSRDGSRIVTQGESERAARLWDSKTGVLVAMIEDKDGRPQVHMSPNGSRLVTRAEGARVARLWDVGAKNYSGQAAQHSGVIAGTSWSHDLSRFVTWHRSDPLAHLWDARSGTVIATLKGHIGPLWWARWSRDGSRFVTWARNDAVPRLWDGRSGALIATLEGHKGEYPSVSVSSQSGSRLVTKSDDPVARLWDGESGTLIAVLEGQGQSILTAEVSQDGSRVLTSHRDHTARLWDGRSGALVATLDHDGRIQAFWSPDGAQFLTRVHNDGVARLWDGKSGALIAVLAGHQGQYLRARWSEDGSRLVTAGDRDREMRLWHGKSGAMIATLGGHQGPVYWPSLNHDGSRILTWAEYDKVARLWDGKSGALIAELGGHQGPIYWAYWSKDKSRLLTISRADRVARLWDAKSGAAVALLQGHQRPISLAHWSEDGSLVATWAEHDPVARLWDAKSGLNLFAFATFGNHSVVSAAISTDKSFVVIVGDKEVGVWRIPGDPLLEGDELISVACSKLFQTAEQPCTTVGPLALRFWKSIAVDASTRVLHELRTALGRARSASQ